MKIDLKIKNLFNQIFKFGIVGIINTFIDFGLFNLLVFLTGIHSGWQVGVLNVIAVATAVINSYLMNRRWTFHATDSDNSNTLPRFIVASSIGMIINSLAVTGIAALGHSLPISIYLLLNAGKIVGAVFSSTWNFIAYRKWVFKTVPQSPVLLDEIPGLVSIVIPAFNEALRLPQRLQKLALTIQDRFPVEIIVVDDGSSDQTANLVAESAMEFPFIRCISYSRNQGKGNAVQTGMLQARGEYLIFVDADETFTVEHIERVFGQLQAGHQIAIATRKGSEGQRIIGESKLRYIMGKTFNFLVQSMVLPGCTDTQCGLKGFRREAAEQIFTRQRVAGFAFDVELLAIARALKLEVVTVPIQAVDCEGSSVNRLLSPLAMAMDIMKIKMNLILNRYGIPGKKLGPQFLLGAGLFVAALAVRIPWLWQIPRYIDELKEVNLAYLIYLNKAEPLHNVAHDIGSMHNYLLAGIFKLFGPSILWPRLYVALTAALTVVLLYRLGEKLFDRWTGLLAAGLLLTNGMHILVTHMAWANCTTPFFFMLAMLATVNAEQKKSGKWLVLAGLLWAAALQTHSSVVIYILVVFIYLASGYFHRSSGIKAPWYGGACVAFLAGYANMIYYNFISRGGSISWATHKQYTLESHPGIHAYFVNLQQMLVELIRTVSSTYAVEAPISNYLFHPAFCLAAILIIIGAYWAIKRSKGLPVWMIIGGMAIIPWINHRYDFYISTRYIMPLVLCALLLCAYSCVQIIQHLAVRRPEKKAIITSAAVSLIIIICLQLIPFYQYCYRVQSTNLSNEVPLQLLSLVQKDSRGGKSIVLMDDKLPLANHPMAYLFALSTQKYLVMPDASNAPNQASHARSKWLIAIRHFSKERIIVIMNHSTYLAMKNDLPGKTYALKSQVGFTKTKTTPQFIYVVELNSHTKVGLQSSSSRTT